VSAETPVKKYQVQLFSEKGSLAVQKEVEAATIDEAFRLFVQGGYRRGEVIMIRQIDESDFREDADRKTGI
jgi:hypothetical protein